MNAAKRLSSLLLSCVGVYVLAGTAQAQNFVFTGSGASSSPATSSIVAMGSGGGTMFVYAGRYQATLNGQPINIFCTDFSHEIHDGDTYAANTQYQVEQAGAAPDRLTASAGTQNYFYSGGLMSAMNAGDYHPSAYNGVFTSFAQRINAVSYLADTYLGATPSTLLNGYSGADFSDNMAGVSLAIWDIIQDGGDGFGTGQVTIPTSGSYTAGYASLGSYYEGMAEGHTDYQSQTALWIQAPRDSRGNHLQDYITEAVPAPEPKFSLMLLSFGVIGLGSWLRQRRRSRDC